MVKCESLRINMYRITHTGKSVNFPVTSHSIARIDHGSIPAIALDHTRSHSIAELFTYYRKQSSAIACDHMWTRLYGPPQVHTWWGRCLEFLRARAIFLTRTIFFIRNYLRIHIFSFAIQQPLFNLQPCWILTNWKSGEGLIMWQGRAGLMNWIWGKISHSPILLWNKSVFPKAMYCFCHCFLYPRTECIM